MLANSITNTHNEVMHLKPIRDVLIENSKYPHIRIARDYGTLRSIGRLRHMQFVSTQGKHYKSAVLDAECLLEILDFSDINIYAINGYNVTAALRIGTLHNTSHVHKDFYDDAASKAGINRNITLTFSRLVRSPSHTGRHVIDLINFVRLQTVTAGYRYGIMQTTERLVPFFSKFDFYPTGLSIEDPASGTFQMMIVDCGNEPVQSRSFPHVG